MKRNSSPKMDKVNPELSQTHKPVSTKKKRCKSSSPKRLENENPQESITIFDGDDSSLRKTKKIIGRFFYENGLDFNAVNSQSFQRMISRFQMKHHDFPTCHELKGWIFKDIIHEMRERVDGIKRTWSHTGCSVLLDGWTDKMGRHLVNILVDCPGGTVYLGSSDISDCFGKTEAMLSFLEKVITKVGLNNVVQIITYSTSSFMKEVGKQLMEKYRPLFWTVSASSCIELMLEKLQKMHLIKETLNDAKTITRFFHHSLPDRGPHLVKPFGKKSTHPFTILENIVMEKQEVRNTFNSISTTDRAADLMQDSSFWSRALTVLKAAIPLVRVIEWMNDHSKNNEQVACIYETIDQAKETIKEEFKSNESQYGPFWKVVDDVWNEFLYSTLHSAGYFLNPNLFYSSDVYIDPEVATGFCCCIVRSTKDLGVQDKILIQMEMYRTAKGAFGVGCKVDERSDSSPAHWWSKYGGDSPELQKLAVRILSQTCDGASKFQLKRNLAEDLLTKGRSRSKIEQKRLADMVFLQYNMQLQNFASGQMVDSYEIDLVDDDWLAEDVKDDASENGDVIWMDLGGGDAANRDVIDLEPKVETVV